MSFRVSVDEPENSFVDGVVVKAFIAEAAAEAYVYVNHSELGHPEEIEVWVWNEGDAESLARFTVHVEATIVCRAVEKKEDQS